MNKALRRFKRRELSQIYIRPRDINGRWLVMLVRNAGNWKAAVERLNHLRRYAGLRNKRVAPGNHFVRRG
jgi:hypothetical protein